MGATALEPEIRFAGFTDPWEQRKLGDCGNTYGGLSAKTKEDFGHGEARFVPYTNVFDNPITDTNRLEAVEIDIKQNEVRRGDALFTVSSETPEEVGMSSVWLSDQRNVYLNSFCFGYRQDGSFDSNYLAYMLRSANVRADLTLLAQGISRFNISKNKVMELEVPCPTIDEQRQVGSFLRQLDNLITLHQRKYDSLCSVKKSMLQKMFPRDGASEPEIRFAGFTDPWEQRKWSETFQVLPNNTLSRADLNSAEGKLRNVHYGDILIKYRERIDASLTEFPYISDPDTASKYMNATLQEGDVVFADTAEDEAVGKCVELRELHGTPVVSGLHTIPCRPVEEFADGYLGYFLNSVSYHNQLVPLMQGIKVTSISKGAIADTCVCYPSYEEQVQIGAYFTQLDNLITLHQRELDLLRKVKQSMLQKMFV